MTFTDSYFAAFSLENTPKMDDWTKVKLKSKVNVGTANNPIEEKREADIFVIDRDDDPGVQQERLMRAVLEFEDARQASRLRLTQGQQLFASFRQILAPGLFRDTWDGVSRDVNATVVNFDTCLTNFIAEFFTAEDYADQLQYMQRYRQGDKINMTDLALRVQTINTMMAKMPGSNGAKPYPTDNDMKVFLYGMSSMAMQFKFRENRDQVMTNEFTLKMLMDKFRFYERVEARKRALMRRFEKRNNNNHGRGHSRVHHGRRTQAKKPRPGVSKEDQPRISNPCKYHNGSHDWKYCFGNPSGPNYRPNYKLPALKDGPKDAMMFDTEVEAVTAKVKEVDIDDVVAAAQKRKAEDEHVQQVAAKWTKPKRQVTLSDDEEAKTKANNSTWMEVDTDMNDA